MKKIYTISAIIFSFVFMQLSASEWIKNSKEANNWFINMKTGITFNNYTDRPQQINSKVSFKWGAQCISDSLGKLLFIIDYQNFLNKNFKTMKGAEQYPTDLNKYSDGRTIYTGCDNLFIIPYPGIPDKYYVFYKQYTTGRDTSLCYSNLILGYYIVDMKADNGLGKVITPLIVEDSNYYHHVDSHAYEGLTATRHFNNKDIWIITVNYTYDTCEATQTCNLIFKAYKVTYKGIDNPLISHFHLDSNDIHYPWGHLDNNLKCSVNGNKLALSMNTYDSINDPKQTDSEKTCLLLFDLDNVSGKVTNKCRLKTKIYYNPFLYSYCDFEFSPDGSKLYTYLYYYPVSQSFFYNSLYQCDLKDSLALNPEISKKPIYEFIRQDWFISDIKLAPDGKIYLGKYYYNQNQDTKIYLDVIHNPNDSITKCKYEQKFVTLEDASHNYYMTIFPHFLYDYSHKPFVILESDPFVCFGQEIRLYSGPDFAISYYWTGPNGFSSNEQNPVIMNSNPSMSGLYKVKANFEGKYYSDSMMIMVSPQIDASISGDTTICGNSTTEIIAEPSGMKYIWWNGDTTRIIRIFYPGKYYLIVENEYGCCDTVYFNIIEQDSLNAGIEGIETICPGFSSFLKATPSIEEYSYYWSTGESTPEIEVKLPGIYKVTITKGACTGNAEIEVKEYPKPVVSINVDQTEFCEGDSAKLTAETEDGNTFLWSTGENTKEIIVHQSGIYRVIVENSNGCRDTTQISITQYPNPKPQITGSCSFCEGSSTQLKVDKVYKVIKWNTWESTDEITVSQAGKYFVDVIDSIGCSGSSETITVIQNPNPKPQITGIESLCQSESGKLKVHQVYKVIKWNTGESTDEITVSQPGTYSVNVVDENGCSGTTSYTVKERKTELSGIINLDIGKVFINKSGQKSLTIRNTGIETIIIKSINLQTSQEYSLSTEPTPLTELLPNDQAELNTTFLSNQTGDFTDNIIIETEQPCKDTYTINLSAECIGHAGKVTIWLPDTSAYAGEKDYCIPLRANYTGEESPLDIGYTAEIRFSSKAMDIQSPIETIENGENIVNFSGNISLNKGYNKLGEFCGMVLLSENPKYPLYINKFEWSEPLATDTVHGSLHILACQETLPAIKTFTPASIEITPNPSNGTADITITGEGNTTLEIYSVQGKLVFKQYLKIEKSKIENFKLDLKYFEAGVYYAIVKSAIGTAGARMNVVK